MSEEAQVAEEVYDGGMGDLALRCYGGAAEGVGRDEDCTLEDIANEVSNSNHLSIAFVVFSKYGTQCCSPFRSLLRNWQNL